MSYTPKPGSTAWRVMAHLETLPAGAEIMTSALAEAIGEPANNVSPCLEAALAAGLLFRRQRDAHVRSPYWWSLTDRSAQPKPPRPRVEVPVFLAQAQDSGTADPVSAADGSQKPNGGERERPVRAGSEHTPKGANRDATGFEGRGEQSPDATDCEARSKVMAPGGSESPTGRGRDAAPALGAAPAFTPAAAGPARNMRCALWSNGVLQIERDTVGGAAELVLLTCEETRQLLEYLDRMREAA